MTYNPKFERDRLGKWSAEKDANFTQVVAGSDAYLMEDDVNLMQALLNEARADLVRAQTHSGVLDYAPTVNSVFNSDPSGTLGWKRGQAQVPGSGWAPNALNSFGLTDTDVLVNGYKIKLKTNTTSAPWASLLQPINLPAPPTYGVRDDLVFLEAWFQEVVSSVALSGDTSVYKYGGIGPGTVANDILDTRKNAETTRRIQLRWRIRTVAGVDFSYAPEGLPLNGTADFPGSNYAKAVVVLAQGGNSGPISEVHYRETFRRADQSYGVYPSIGQDMGLYIAGDGSQTSKDTLKTVDGYVYAIPLFRVKRRNSGGYRKDNVNGALEYTSFTFPAPSSSVPVGGTTQLTLSSAAYDVCLVGQSYISASGTYKWTVLSKDGSSQVTVQNTSAASSITSALVNTLISDRPDGLYSNVIDPSDIIDLRHKVSLSGVNYQQVVEQSFDALIRGNLMTKDTVTATRDVYGLRKAPYGIPQELQPTTIKRADGASVELTNLFGLDGKCEDLSNFYTTNSTLTVDSANAKYGTGAIKVTATASGTAEAQLKRSIDTGYYIAIADVKMGTATSAAIKWGGSGTSVNSSDYKTIYKTYNIPSLGLATIAVSVSASAAGQYAYLDGFRLYKIDQATYNLIDVDPSWTGADNIAAKFPYIDSYPNWTENMIYGERERDNAAFNQGSTSGSYANAWVNGKLEVYNGSSQYAGKGVLLSSLVNGKKYRITANAQNASDGAGLALCANSTDANNPDYGIANNSVSGANAIGTISLSFTATTATLLIRFLRTGSSNTSAPVRFWNIKLECISGFSSGDVYVPYGRWYIDKDYLANAHLGTPSTYHYPGINGDGFNGQRQVMSDALTSQAVTDIVEALKTPQKHITVTQATAGQWAAGDTIKIRNDYGSVVGPPGSGTAKATVLVSVTDVNPTVQVNDTTSFAVGDTVLARNETMGDVSYPAFEVLAVDTVNKTIQFDTLGVSFFIGAGWFLLETTAQPTTTATGIAGTWSGIGTNEMTYTISTAPTTNTDSIKIAYSAVYPPGKGISYVPTSSDLVEVNGQRLVSSATTSFKANFVGKVAGSSDANAHKFYYDSRPGVYMVPLEGAEYDTAVYTAVSALDAIGQTYTGTLSNTYITQHLFSFNLIRGFEDKFGEIPGCVTTAEKVAWLKSNISKLYIQWWGYGSGPNGNKVYLAQWAVTNSSWNNAVNHTSATTASLGSTANTTDPANYRPVDRIDDNGLVNYLVYADASDGTTSSTIIADYVELSVTLNTAETGYTVFQPENGFPVMSENLLTSNQAFPVDVSGFALYGTNTTIAIDSPGVVRADTKGSNTTNDKGILVSNVNLPANTMYAFSVEAKAPVGTAMYLMAYNGSTTIKSSVFTATGDYQKLSAQFKDSSVITNVYVYVDKSTNVDVSLYVRKLKVQAGPTATEWTPGRQKTKTLNFLGKVAASASEVPHKAYGRQDFSSGNPTTASDWFERSQIGYDAVKSVDGTLDNVGGSTAGSVSFLMYEFDLSHYGLSLSELKKAVRSMVLSWTGYGKGDSAGANAYGATLRAWRSDLSAWSTSGASLYGTNTTSAPATLSVSTPSDGSGSGAYITPDQKVYVLAQATYSATATNPSVIYTDYIKLDVTLADYVDYIPANVVKVRPETKEVKTMFPAISRRYIGNGGAEQQVRFSYRYLPYQGAGAGTSAASYSNFKVLTDTIMLATTEGSGNTDSSYRGASQAVRNIVNRLPTNNVTIDYTMSGNVSYGGMEGKTLLLPLPVFRIGYQIPVVYGYGDLVDTANVAAPFRGAWSVDAWSYGKEAFLPDDSRPNLCVVARLILYNGELYLRVATSEKFAKPNVGATDLFRLPGRPLVKGV